MDTYYAIGDIHGCYNEFIEMIKKIDFKQWDDFLILIGDYIDRGPDSYKMIQWLENERPKRCVALQGNHEAEFVANVDIISSIDDTYSLTHKYNKLKESCEYFDIYNTIGNLIKHHNATIDELIRWANMFRKMPLWYNVKIYGKRYICVHAGFPKESMSEEEKENFLLYARDEAYTVGGYKNTTVISGHTPTLIENTFSYNNGDVFKYINEQTNCTFYNIDCGCVFRSENNNGKLAGIRLYDDEIYYV